MEFPTFSKNGTILPISQAVVPLDNLEYAYGYGVYETIKVRNSILYFGQQHVERLFHSAELIQIQHSYFISNTISHIQNFVSSLEVDSCNLKIMLIGGKTSGEADLYIFATSPLYPDRKLYKYGAKTITAHYERWLPNAKSLNMLPSYLIYRKATLMDCYDALLIDRDGCIREGTRTNFFVIKGRTVVSPPTNKILEGVTRKTIISVLKQNNFDYEERDIPLESIHTFDGAVLSSTSTKIIPIREIDDQQISIKDTVYELMKHYDSFLKTCNGIYNDK